ncbi:MAG: hypothetical protein ACM3KL_06330 [Alphaproteobacteria bacterium]
MALVAGEESERDEPQGRLHFTEKDLPTDQRDPTGLSEIADFARARGFRYGRDTRRAARGDAKALKAFFQLAHDADGAAAEGIAGVPTVVYHLLGDEKFASFLKAQSLAFQMMVRNDIISGGPSSRGGIYFGRYFPRTSELFFRNEIVDWFSPNDAYAIRKIFTDEGGFSCSKVQRAELIEKKTGRVLCELTPGDIGTGAQREGEALWSPDSLRVACLSSDMTEQKGNLFSTPRPAPLRKQTAVYQFSKGRFVKVDLALNEGPVDSAGEDQLKGAILGHTYMEPMRWETPNVLILRQHNYYEKEMPTQIGNTTFNTIHGFARTYEIRATIEPDGKGHASWKLSNE